MINFGILGKAIKDVAGYAVIVIGSSTAGIAISGLLLFLAIKFGLIVFPIAGALCFLGVGIASRYEHHYRLDQESKKKMMEVLTR